MIPREPDTLYKDFQSITVKSKLIHMCYWRNQLWEEMPSVSLAVGDCIIQDSWLQITETNVNVIKQWGH